MNRRRQLPAMSKHRFRRAGVAAAAVIGLAAVSLVVLVFALPALTGEVRTWSSASGAYKTEAELVQIKDDGTVVLKKKDGTMIEVPLDKLSVPDQEYARAHSKLKPGGTPPMAGGAGTAKSTGGAGAAKSASEPPKTPEEIEAEALACHSAKEAVLIYKFYLAKPNLTALQRKTAEANLEAWKKKADDDMVRLGTQWMKKAEADEIRKKADAKIEQAMELLRLHNGDLARQTLEEASLLDPDSIKADFLMGVVYGLVNNDRKSQLHFEKCLKREPGNVSVLNNLAVSLAAQKKFVDAAKHWKTAATTAPKFQGLAQNIGSLITMAGSGIYKVPAKTLSDLNQVYADLVAHGNARPTKIGFVYTPPYGADWNSDKAKRRRRQVGVRHRQFGQRLCHPPARHSHQPPRGRARLGPAGAQSEESEVRATGRRADRHLRRRGPGAGPLQQARLAAGEPGR